MEVAQKPTFYSDSDFFIVTLPNRSVATPAQVSMESVASGAESAETSAESAETSTVLHGMSTDAEVRELCKRLDNTRLTASTKERTLELFKRYRYQYQFRSINVAQLYGVQKSSFFICPRVSARFLHTGGKAVFFLALSAFCAL